MVARSTEMNVARGTAAARASAIMQCEESRWDAWSIVSWSTRNRTDGDQWALRGLGIGGSPSSEAGEDVVDVDTHGRRCVAGLVELERVALARVLDADQRDRQLAALGDRGGPGLGDGLGDRLGHRPLLHPDRDPAAGRPHQVEHKA